jgi:hypothetical protein
MIMKKNLFILMLSTFVLTNAQQSYAVEPGEEEKKSSSSAKPKKWIPQAPIKDQGVHKKWLARAALYPEEFKLEGTTPWIFQ